MEITFFFSSVFYLFYLSIRISNVGLCIVVGRRLVGGRNMQTWQASINHGVALTIHVPKQVLTRGNCNILLQ